ncbi:unnamed protein product [Sphacelaria rigidula]
MELELRYTLESFEGQLSAMAREKVALQKQVKELTGQCGTVRKQVSHYRKLAKESEAQVEQVSGDLFVASIGAHKITQHRSGANVLLTRDGRMQLCDAEAAVENLRITNGNLTSKIEKLEASAGQEALWRQSKVWLLALPVSNIAHRNQACKYNCGFVFLTKLRCLVLSTSATLARPFFFHHFRAASQLSAISEALSYFFDNLDNGRTVLTRPRVSCVLLYYTQDELLALRARLAGADERESVRATELAAKSEEVLAARAHHATLTSKTEELESELRALHDHAASVATELARALSRAKELESAAARVPELEVAVAALADEKTQTVSSIRGEAEQAQAKVKELGIVVRSLQEDKERALHKAQQADREREGVMAQLGSISTSLGCALCDGNDSTAARVMEEIRILMTRLEASENVIQDAVHVLKQTSAKEGGPAEDSSWIISGITDLQGRLRVAEMKVSERRCTRGAGTTGRGARAVGLRSQRGQCNGVQVALQEAQEEIYRLTDTLRKERLMMMVFRRWGHFYLALSNQALRKRTRERNQVRNQRHTPPQTSPGERTGSDGAPPVSFKNHERVRLSSQDIQVMVEKEVETVSRELAEEPSLALLDLTEARSDMDEMAMRAQVKSKHVGS